MVVEKITGVIDLHISSVATELRLPPRSMQRNHGKRQFAPKQPRAGRAPRPAFHRRRRGGRTGKFDPEVNQQVAVRTEVSARRRRRRRNPLS